MKSSKGFSLIEVVVAVGIFAFAIVGVLGLLSPTGRAISDVADNDAASRAIGAIQSGLQDTFSGRPTGFTDLAALFQPAGSPAYSLYATKGGDKLGTAGTVAAADRFFEFALVRDTALSPPQNDSTAGFMAFTIILRWPSHLPSGTPVPDSQKSSLTIPAAVTR